MTALVTIKWEYPDGQTPLRPQPGSVYLEPMKGWIEGDAYVNHKQTRHSTTTGTITLSLPNDNARVWKVRHDPAGTRSWVDHVLVPPGDPDTITAIEYRALVKVDPETFTPTPEVLANAIEVVAAETVTSGQVVDGDLILTRGDGTSINAGTVTGPDSPTITDLGTTVQIGA